MARFVEEQLDALKATYQEYARVISALLLRDGVQTYDLDTGQGKQRVTAVDLPMLQNTSMTLLAQIDAIESNGAVTQGRPGW